MASKDSRSRSLEPVLPYLEKGSLRMRLAKVRGEREAPVPSGIAATARATAILK